MKRILVAYDGDEPAHRALERGAQVAQAFGAELGVVSVTPWRSGRSPLDVWGNAEAHESALESAGEWLSRRGLRATLLAPTGDPGPVIEKVAESGEFDTIVVGTRDLGTVDRLMQRSVSRHLAGKAKATVVIAR
jgi:nucleotide-binding universal stress UspA family protein